MNRKEAAELLTVAAAFDRRTLGDADVVAWADALCDVNGRDALEAVRRHYRESREFVMPADVRRLVRQIRNERLDATPLPAPPAELCSPDREADYRAWLRRTTRAIADGEPLPDGPALARRDVRALTDGAFR